MKYLMYYNLAGNNKGLIGFIMSSWSIAVTCWYDHFAFKWTQYDQKFLK